MVALDASWALIQVKASRPFAAKLRTSMGRRVDRIVMAGAQFTVTTFGNRWAVHQGARRLSITETLDLAMKAVLDLAAQATEVGSQAVILVQGREGGWREFVYTHESERHYTPRRQSRTV